MTSVPLEVSVAEFAKGVDDIFERQLKLLDELRESFRLIAEAMQKSLHPQELPPLEEIGVNNNYFHRKVTTSEVSRTKSPSPPVQF
ncbi:hypothetical protein [Pseudomonas sp. S2_A02]